MAGNQVSLVLRYFGLREQPFGATPDPRFMLSTDGHQEALATLVYGIGAGVGFASLIAEPGMGKTTLLYALLERFRPTARTAFLFQTQCDRRELLELLLADLNVEFAGASPATMYERLRDTLLLEARAGRRVLVVIDEAQNLDLPVLESLRLLTNFESADAKLLQIVLSGQPSLAAKLAHPELLQLLQRVSVVARLQRLGPGEVRQYVEHRLQVGGRRGPPLFTEAAMERLAAMSGGIPRTINGLAFNAMSLACALRKQVIGTEILNEVAADLDLSFPPTRAAGASFAGLATSSLAAALAETGADVTAQSTSGEAGGEPSGWSQEPDSRRKVLVDGAMFRGPAAPSKSNNHGGALAYRPEAERLRTAAEAGTARPALFGKANNPGSIPLPNGLKNRLEQASNPAKPRHPAPPAISCAARGAVPSRRKSRHSVYQLTGGSAAGIVGAVCLLILIVACWFMWTTMRTPSSKRLDSAGHAQSQVVQHDDGHSVGFAAAE